MNRNNHLVIMAGGVGSRFWPMSSEAKPKQFLDILGTGRTLIQMTADRFSGIVPTENIWVVTSSQYAELVYEQLPEIPQGNVLLEPCRRNTAPCVCYVSWRIKCRNPRANVVVSPSDHIITDTEEFKRIVNRSLEFTGETDAIVTLGIRPSRPETGYGYIEADLSVGSSRRPGMYRVDSFKEKPSLEVAQEYIRQSNYLWNSGIFVWSIQTIINAFRVYQPAMSKAFEALSPYYGTPEEQEYVDKLYADCQSISVDYAIMEKAEDIFVCPSDFGWSDLGTWSSLLEQSKKDEYGNAYVGGKVKLFESHGCIVHTVGLQEVVVQGLDNCIVAEQDGKLLICRLSEEQRIKLFHD